jgi:aldehyde dehydrogenase (NAD+)
MRVNQPMNQPPSQKSQLESIDVIYSSLLARAADRRYWSRERDLQERERSLIRLKKSLIAMETEILDALKEDLGRNDFESYVNEFGFVMKELERALLEFRSWSKERVVDTPVVLWPAKSVILTKPKGAILILSPWNYPFHLSLAPLVSAVAAGNYAVIKPSEFAPATAQILQRLAARTWPDGEVVVITGGAQVAEELLNHRWDHVFFTGSTEIGKKVMAACAQFLTPVTLELGGKSPCLIGRFGHEFGYQEDASSQRKFEVAVRRILWGKSVNAGQTCVAPDFVLVHREDRARFLDVSRRILAEFHGADPLRSDSMCRIVSRRHFDRLVKLLTELDPGEILHGGRYDSHILKMEITLVEADSYKRIHREEIFGPILPVIEWETDEDIKTVLARHPRPLAFYAFSGDPSWAREKMRQNVFGGGCIGDTILHLANPELPFGGCGESGIGSYHGRFGFDVFSQQQSILERRYIADLKLRYPPYSSLWRRMKGLFS